MLRLHPDHGLNPTMPLCFWCQKPTGEIALLGAAYKSQAPHEMILDHNPCQSCRDIWGRGIACFEMHSDHKTPTGSYVVLTEDATRRLMHPGPELDRVLQARSARFDQETFQHLFGNAIAKEPTQ